LNPKNLLARVRPVILCGGKGERLWPLSRANNPKQFITINGEHSLFQNTVKRTVNIFGADDLLIVTHESYVGLVIDQIESLKTPVNFQIISEPTSKNTAPAISIATQFVDNINKGSLIAVFPSDHYINGVDELQTTLEKAIPQAEAGRIVTIGIKPSRPESGFGYIKLGEMREAGYDVAAFIEKPSQSKALQFLDTGEFLWNSGMFIFTTTKLIESMDEFCKVISQTTQTISQKFEANERILRISAADYSRCPETSLDCAVMEKLADSHVVTFEGEWNDIGSWAAVAELGDKDNRGNSKKGDVTILDSDNCNIFAKSRLVAIMGMKDVSIVETDDSVLVMPTSESQNIRQITETLNKNNHPVMQETRKTMRPWGYFESLLQEDFYQVKKIVVNSGESLSLQKHKFRCEHWIVVSGEAEVRIGNTCSKLVVGDSVDIPKGEIHRLKNEAKSQLVIIEIQLGSYLGEDDIIRLDDIYGRTS